MHRRASSFLPLFFLLACALFILSPLVADPDLWGHVRFGQDALSTGQIVRPDVYSYLTRGQPWINHEWLTEVLYALAYNAARAGGLIALNSLLNLVIAGLIYWRLRRARMHPLGAILLTLGACLVLRPAVLTVRPQELTYLLFLLLLLLIDAYTPANRRAHLDVQFVAAIFVLLVLWVNLHGGVLAGLGVLYLWGIIRLVEGVVRDRSAMALWRSPQRGITLALLLAPLALCLNPYGPGLIKFLLRTATVARPEILEWHGARLADPWSQYWLIALALTCLAVVFSRRPRRVALLAPLAVVALLPLSAIRHIPLFALAAPVLAADHFADLWDRLAALVAARLRLQPVAQAALPWLFGVGAIIFAFLAAPQLCGIVVVPVSANFPVRAVAVMKAAGVEGNLATEFNWGEYVLWRLGPSVQVSVDGRRETVYPEAIYRENLDFMLGEGQWDHLIDRPETQMALVDRGRPAYDLMRVKVGWVLAYEDETAALFVREGSPWQGAIGRVTPPAWPANGAGMAFPLE